MYQIALIINESKQDVEAIVQLNTCSVRIRVKGKRRCVQIQTKVLNKKSMPVTYSIGQRAYINNMVLLIHRELRKSLQG